MKKLNLIFIFCLFLLPTHKIYASIEIKFKIGNEIITNIDIINEKNYLIFLRPNLADLSNKEILKIAENSLIREIIKRKELNRVFKDKEDLDIMSEIKKNLFRYKNVSNENEFISLLKKNNITYEEILTKMKYEALWNEYIFQKYSSFIKVNKEKLKDELKNKIANDIKFEYNLSEILFDIEKKETYENKYTSIIKFIKDNNFKSAAAKFSISNSATRGGEIGWVKETMLSKNLINILEKMEINNISKPIKYPNGYLVLKINNKREMKQIMSIEDELRDLVNFERNKQLSQFSLLFFKKLKQNISINEY